MVSGSILRRAVISAAALSLCACASGERGPAAEASGSDPSSTEEIAALFVANKRGDSLSKIVLSTGETQFQVEACRTPHELATSPDGGQVAVACYGGEHISIFETDRLMRSGRVLLGANARPHGIVWHESGALYATAEGRQSIYRVRDPLGRSPEIAEFPTGKEGSHMIAVAPDESAAWTTDLGSRTVTRIDLAGDAAPISVTVGEEPEGIALSPDGETLWVSARGSNQAFALDPVTMEVRSTIETGQFPLRLAIRPQGDVAVTSDLMDGGLTVIDLNGARVIRSIAVSSPETAQERFQVTILWSGDGSKIYVAETASNTVAEVDYETGTVLRRLTTGEGGDGLAILP